MQASVLSVTAVGLSLVFGVMRVVNVAQGEFFMLGAVFAWFVSSLLPGHPTLGFIAALVIAPQATRIAIPPTIGFLVELVKGTSLTSIIGFVELTRAAQIVNNATFHPFTIFGIVALAYFVICWPLSVYSRRMERRLAVARR